MRASVAVLAGAEIFVILQGSVAEALKSSEKGSKKYEGRFAIFLFVDAGKVPFLC